MKINYKDLNKEILARELATGGITVETEASQYLIKPMKNKENCAEIYKLQAMVVNNQLDSTLRELINTDKKICNECDCIIQHDKEIPEDTKCPICGGSDFR